MCSGTTRRISGTGAETRLYYPFGLQRGSAAGAPFEMFIEARHDLNKIAGHVAVVELVGQNAIPGVLAGTGRSRQAKDKCRFGQSRRCPIGHSARAEASTSYCLARNI